MEAWYRRSKFTYPAGVLPGWDPTHPAARLIRLSAVVQAGTFWEIAPYRQQSTLTATAPTFSNHGILGPIGIFTASTNVNACAIAGLSTANDGAATLAAIFSLNAAPASTVDILATSSASTPDSYAINISTGLVIQFVGCNAAVASTFTITAGHSYFFAYSTISGRQNFVLTDLNSGQISTLTGTQGYTAAVQTGTANIGCWSATSQAGPSNIAAVMWSGTFLGLGTLKQWAADPWAFWYPQPEENWVGVVAAATNVPELALLGVGM